MERDNVCLYYLLSATSLGSSSLHNIRYGIGRMGRWVGFGLTLGYIPDRRERIDGLPNPDYLLYVPYAPHIEAANWHFDRFIATGCHLMQFAREIEKLDCTFPAFEEWVDREILAQIHQYRVLDSDGKIKGYKIKSVGGLRNYFTNLKLIGYWVYKGELVSVDNHKPILDIDKFMYVYNKISSVRLDGTANEEVLERRKRYTKRYYSDYEAILKNHIEPLNPKKRINVCPNPIEKDGERAEYYYGFYNRNDDFKTAKYMLSCQDVDRIFLRHFIDRLQKAEEFTEFLNAEQAEQGEQQQIERDVQIQITATKSLLRKIEQQVDSGEFTNPKLAQRANKRYGELEMELQRLEQNLEHVTRGGTKARKRRTYKQMMYEVGEVLDEETLDELIPPNEMPEFIDAFIQKVVVDTLGPRFYKLHIHWVDPMWGIDELFCYRGGNPSSVWSAEEKALLKEHLLTMSREELMKLLPQRSYRSIATMALKLGLRCEGMYKIYPDQPYDLCWGDWQIIQEYGLTEEETRGSNQGRLIIWLSSSPKVVESDNSKVEDSEQAHHRRMACYCNSSQ